MTCGATVRTGLMVRRSVRSAREMDTPLYNLYDVFDPRETALSLVVREEY